MNDCPSGAGAPALHRVVSFRLCFVYPWFHRFSDAATEGRTVDDPRQHGRDYSSATAVAYMVSSNNRRAHSRQR